MRTAGGLVLAFVLSACTSYKNSKDVVKIGGGLILGTIVIGGSIVEKSEDITFEDAAPTMAVLITTGAIIALVGLGGMIVHGVIPDDDEPQTTPPPPAAGPAYGDDARRAAWSAFQEARVAAYHNDCARVAALAARVMELDRGIYDTYFVRDAYVVRCSAAPSPAPPR